MPRCTMALATIWKKVSGMCKNNPVLLLSYKPFELENRVVQVLKNAFNSTRIQFFELYGPKTYMCKKC